MICKPARDTLSGSVNFFLVLFGAISRKSYSHIYQVLGRHTGVFRPNQARLLLETALDEGLTVKAVRAILKHCPPVSEFLPHPGPGTDIYYCMMGRAARRARPNVMAALLEHGASPNRSPGFRLSPLEAALKHNALNSVKLLLEQPDLDTAWTDELLMFWADPSDPHPRHKACIRVMAPRFTGWDPHAGQPLPIPESMTLEIIVRARNAPLLERFCRERGPISLEEGLHAIEIFDPGSMWFQDDESVRTSLLTTLLQFCPKLLRDERVCQVLLRCFLRFGENEQARLRPWVERLRRRGITMKWYDWFDEKLGGHIGFLEHWQSLLPRGPVLTINRWSDFIFPECPLNAALLSRILSACPVRGGGRKGEVSPVAEIVLRCGDLPLIEALFRQPHGLLATEDPDALIRYVLEAECPRANRAAVLAHVQREADYAL